MIVNYAHWNSIFEYVRDIWKCLKLIVGVGYHENIFRRYVEGDLSDIGILTSAWNFTAAYKAVNSGRGRVYALWCWWFL